MIGITVVAQETEKFIEEAAAGMVIAEKAARTGKLEAVRDYVLQFATMDTADGNGQAFLRGNSPQTQLL